MREWIVLVDNSFAYFMHFKGNSPNSNIILLLFYTYL